MKLLGVEEIKNFGNELGPYKDLNHADKARLVCVSDTHNKHADLNIPEGDVFIHAGDITQRGTLAELSNFNEWLATLPHKHKIVIGGNHDEILQNSSINKDEVLSNCTYLENSTINLYGWKIYGFPSSVRMFSNQNKPAFVPGFLYSVLNHLKPYQAFQLELGSQAHLDAVSSIPSDINILISHGPPYGACDFTNRGYMEGDKQLRDVVENQIEPTFHIFGHIHEAHGVATNGKTTFINAASPKYPWSKGELNNPIVFDIDITKK